MRRAISWVGAIGSLLLVVGCAIETVVEPRTYDVILRSGTVYDGSGAPGRIADVALAGDRIALVAQNIQGIGREEIDVEGLAVAPGFINMLSHAGVTLIQDGRAMSDVLQGVTLEVLGEGETIAPVNAWLRDWILEHQADSNYDIEWSSMGDYLDYVDELGVAPNVASVVGATTVRLLTTGFDLREVSSEELKQMRALVRNAMEEGALGLGSSLIYGPAVASTTDELIALASIVAEYDGIYISHIRSESNRLTEAVEEVMRIAEQADVRAEIYHLKMAGHDNWHKYDEVVNLIESARRGGLEITANMYTYTAGKTGLDAAMPPWVQVGGYDSWARRLEDPEVRERVALEMTAPSDEWENLYYHAGPEGTLLVDFRNPELRRHIGRTLAGVASDRGVSPEETAMDLVVADGSKVGVVYFLMSEDNVRKQIALPWMSFGSDGGAPTAEGVFLRNNVHPRTYGNFARLLGKYVREEQVIPLQEAIRKLTSLPAENLRIRDRGRLEKGLYADIVVFDPATVTDHATFAEPHQYATGVLHVFVNGEQVVRDGEHTGALPGRAIRGPGWIGGARHRVPGTGR
ncbi:MAG: D-aminoacylase [Pseudomonadales bacterium]